MKYTTTLKSALALALGLVVGTASATTTDVQKYGATFESTGAPSVSNDYAYAVGDKLNAEVNGQPKYQTVTGGATSGWLVGSNDDESAISNRTDAAGGQMLWLNTDANTLTNKFAGATDVNAIMPIPGAVILVILSVLLTFIGGLIPAKKASRKDPVLALRSE